MGLCWIMDRYRPTVTMVWTKSRSRFRYTSAPLKVPYVRYILENLVTSKYCGCRDMLIQLFASRSSMLQRFFLILCMTSLLLAAGTQMPVHTPNHDSIVAHENCDCTCSWEYGLILVHKASLACSYQTVFAEFLEFVPSKVPKLSLLVFIFPLF